MASEHRRIRSLEEIVAATTRNLELLSADIQRMKLENDQRAAENDRRAAENDRRHAENELRRMEEAEIRKEEQAAYWAKWERERDAFRSEMREIIKDMSREWGRLANKMGTLMEDVVAPNMPRIAHEHFGLPEQPQLNQQRMRIMHPAKDGRLQEFDQLLVYQDAVVLVEVKSALEPEYVKRFLKKGVSTFRDYFPQHHHLPVIPVFAAPSIPESLVRGLSRQHIYAAALADGTVDLLNADAFDWRQPA